MMSIGIPLVQEKMKAEPIAVAVWNKIGVAAFMVLPVIYLGFPDNPRFYIFAAISSLIWAVSDVIYFKTVTETGAGVVSRLIPSAVILSFLGWFAYDPSLLFKYLENPVQGGLLFAIVIAATIFAMNLKSCPLSWQGFKLIWFVILAAAIAPLVEKVSLGGTPKPQMPFAFIFVQALMMLGFWGLFAWIKRPISRAILFEKTSWQAGLLISIFSTLALVARFTALQYVEHPALLSVLLFTDALWILAYYRLTGRKDDSKIWAGLGIVGCAAALVLVKSL